MSEFRKVYKKDTSELQTSATLILFTFVSSLVL